MNVVFKVVQLLPFGSVTRSLWFLQIPLRDCKKIEFVEKENNPFNEWASFVSVFARSPCTLMFIQSVKLVRWPPNHIWEAPRWKTTISILMRIWRHVYTFMTNCHAALWVTKVVFCIFLCVCFFRPRPSAISISCVQVCCHHCLILYTFSQNASTLVFCDLCPAYLLLSKF